MNSKTLSFVFASILASLLLVSVVSALTFSSPSTMNLGNNQTTTVLSDSDNVTAVSLSLSPSSDPLAVTFDVVPKSSFNVNSSNSQTVTITSNAIAPLTFKEYVATLTANGTNSTSGSVSTTTQIKFMKGFCKSGPVGGNLSIDRVDVSNSGDDDYDWKPLDEITVEVRINNDGDDTVREVNVRLALFNDAGKDKIGSVDFISADEETVNLGSINDGDDKTATFTFRIPADFNFDDGSSYKLAVKAYSDKTGETKECVDSSDDLEDGNGMYQSISIDRQDNEDKFISFDQISVSPEATCGDALTLSAQVYNVGDSDQDQVTVYLDNKALGIAKQFDIKSGLNTDEDKTATFDFNIPSNAKDGTYYLELTADYDDGSSEDPTIVPIKIIGCQIVPVVTNQTQNQTTTPAENETKVSAWTSLKNAFSGNGMIWLIAAINIILIVVIIIVAVRIARR